MKGDTIKIFTLVLVACLVYARNPDLIALRVLYSVCLYASVLQMIIVFSGANYRSEILPKAVNRYFYLLVFTVVILLLKDFNNKNFNFITLINNQNSLATVVPILSFSLGYRTQDLRNFYTFLTFVTLLFIVFFAFPHIGPYHYYHGYVCATIILPFFILSHAYKKLRGFSLILVGLAITFSVASDYRIIMLRMCLFFALYLAFRLFKRQNLGKAFLLIITGFCVFQFIVNFESILNFFSELIGYKSFAVDTRTFLYQELFEDLKPFEVLTGRGFLGTYFSDFFFRIQIEGLMQTGTFENRFINEVGFLQLILKGGILFFVVYSLPLVYTSLRGLFHFTCDNLSFAFSIYILSEFILMFFENLPAFDLGFFTLFFITGFTYARLENAKTLHHEILTQNQNRIKWNQFNR